MGFYKGFHKVFRHPLKWLFRVKAEGIENVPEGGCILAANHTAIPDVIVISAPIKRQVRYMAKAELIRTPVVGPFMRVLGAYPVDRGGTDVKSLKYTMELIESGELIGIFPQGTRRPGVDPRETEVKGGVGLIAYHTGADVLPVFIDTKKRRTAAFRRTRVIFGPVIKNSELGFEHGGSREYLAAAELIFDRICSLKDGGRTE